MKPTQPLLSQTGWERWRLSLLGLAVLLIVVIPFLILQQLAREGREAADAVSHAHQVESAVHAMTVELREGEAAAMTIALGGDIPAARARLAESRGTTLQGLQRIIRLTAGNSAQQVRLGQLKEIMGHRQALVQRLADALPEQRPSLVQQLMFLYPVRDALQEILTSERALLANRVATAERQRRQAGWLGWGAMLVQLALLVGVTALLRGQMLRRLDAERGSARAAARAAAMLQTVREPIVLFDRERRVLMHNAAFAELYGLDAEVPPERLPAENLSLDAVGEGAWSDPVLQQRLGDVLARGRELWDYEHEQRTADGVARVLLLNARRMPLPDREDEVVLMTLSDVTAQKYAQQRIIDLNRQLEGKVEQVSDVNRELEAFSYSVSHDLRAPLRHISGFADKLARHLGEGADEKSRHYLQVIGDSARRMSALIDDLLVYSRLGRSALRLQAVDMQSLVAETRAMLDANLHADDTSAARRVEWHIAPLPILVADENMMRQVWQNLLGNAVKYSATREVAVIHVGHQVRPDGAHHFSVRDNGTGFDMAYAGKLFGVFQRLHKASEYPGTGVGLASVRRVLGRHGGRIWAEAAPEQGATFHFVIPPAPEAPVLQESF